MSRIVTPDGAPISGDDGKKRPPTPQERVQESLGHWQAGNKDQAFALALNSIVYLSQGLAGMAKLTNKLENDNELMRRRLELLEGKTK